MLEMMMVLVILGIVIGCLSGLFTYANKTIGKLQTLIRQAQSLQPTVGSTISAVKFCPGYTVSYPTTWPEYGFCINGDLYATITDKGTTFTTKVAPGGYSSTSTSAPCNFTYIGACQIKPL